MGGLLLLRLLARQEQGRQLPRLAWRERTRWRAGIVDPALPPGCCTRRRVGTAASAQPRGGVSAERGKGLYECTVFFGMVRAQSGGVRHHTCTVFRGTRPLYVQSLQVEPLFTVLPPVVRCGISPSRARSSFVVAP